MSSIVESHLIKSIKRYKVKDGTRLICDDAFKDCEYLEDIELPSTINFIGKRAFYNCDKLNNIILPENLVYIGDAAFYCNYIRRIPLRVNIPSSVERISGNPFGYNSIISANNKRYKVIDNVLYTADGKELISYCCPNDEFIIPYGVEKIGVHAFRNTPIRKITFPETLKIIDKEAFYDAYDLEYVEFPSSLKAIREKAFGFCNFKCNIVRLPDSVDIIESDAFDFDGEIKIIQISQGLHNHFKSILPKMSYTKLYAGEIIVENDLCFNHDKSEVLNAIEEAEDYIIPEGVIKIHDDAFCYIEEINIIKFPETLKSIPQNLFEASSIDINRILVPKGMKEYYWDVLKDYQDVIEIY